MLGASSFRTKGPEGMEAPYSKPMSNKSKPASKGSLFPRRALITTTAVAGIGGVVVAAPVLLLSLSST